MNIKEISVTYGRKVQLKQFEPVDYRETIVAELDEDDDTEAVSKELADLAESHVEREVLNRVLAHKMEDGREEE